MKQEMCVTLTNLILNIYTQIVHMIQVPMNEVSSVSSKQRKVEVERLFEEIQ